MLTYFYKRENEITNQLAPGFEIKLIFSGNKTRRHFLEYHIGHMHFNRN